MKCTASVQCSEEIATVCAMLGVGNAIFYTPKDKKVHAENAHKAFHRGNVGDHIALMNVYNGYKENGSSSSWCYENFVQVGGPLWHEPQQALSSPRCCLGAALEWVMWEDGARPGMGGQLLTGYMCRMQGDPCLSRYTVRHGAHDCVGAVQQRSMKRADDIRDQIVGLMDRTEVPLVSNLGDNDRIKKTIAAGFFYNTANLQKNGSYRTVKNPQSVHIHPSSGMAEVRHLVSLHT